MGVYMMLGQTGEGQIAEKIKYKSYVLHNIIIPIQRVITTKLHEN